MVIWSDLSYLTFVPDELGLLTRRGGGPIVTANWIQSNCLLAYFGSPVPLVLPTSLGGPHSC